MRYARTLSFLDSVVGAARAAAPAPTGRRLAVVDAAYDPSTYPATLPRVTFDGESTLTTQRYVALSPYLPLPGDRVLMERVGHTYVIMGAIASTTPPYSRMGVHQSALNAQQDTITATAFDLPGTSMNITLRKGARWAAHWVVDAENRAATAATLIVRVAVGGVEVPDPEAHHKSSNVAAGMRLSVGAHASGETTSAGALNFKLRAFRVGGANADYRIYSVHTSLQVITFQ